MSSLRNNVKLARSDPKPQAFETSDIRPTFKQAQLLLEILSGQRTRENARLPDKFPVISFWRR
ncbi:MAG: hypothetical protein L0154_03865 [Chloroflexi bacterium]|nr:hypothetical protein [Chloroflexota bacterium]